MPDQVEVRQQNMVRRKYKVKGLTELGASQMMFHNDVNDTNLSVAAYYEERYKFKCALPLRLIRPNSTRCIRYEEPYKSKCAPRLIRLCLLGEVAAGASACSVFPCRQSLCFEAGLQRRQGNSSIGLLAL